MPEKKTRKKRKKKEKLRRLKDLGKEAWKIRKNQHFKQTLETVSPKNSETKTRTIAQKGEKNVLLKREQNVCPNKKELKGKDKAKIDMRMMRKIPFSWYLMFFLA